MPPSLIADRARSWTRFDPAPTHRQPRVVPVLAATILSVCLSLSADALIVAAGTRIFPGTAGYVHFRFSDYAKLTVIGVVVSCAAWPVVTRVTSAPRWVFLRLAVLVTAVLLLPDLYIWLRGQPGGAVLILVVMHLAIGVVTYNLLVRLAPAGAREPALLSP